MVKKLLLTTLKRVLRDVARTALRSATTAQRTSQKPGRPSTAQFRTREKSDRYPGDFTGKPSIVYSPHPDGTADPGEIVWTWVPYEEDHSQGKDRPVLLIGRDGQWLLGLQVTSQDHDRDAAQEARAGRHWVDIGAGDWDPKGRPSEVRVNRIIRVDQEAVRRMGAVLGRERFDQVAREVERHFN